METPKIAIIKKEKKRTFWQEQLAQLCSQIVYFFLCCVSFNFALLCWKHYKNRGFSKNKNTKKNLALNIDPS